MVSPRLLQSRCGDIATLLIGIQNVVSATSELWPTMSAVMRAPWQGLGRQTAGGARQRQPAQASEATQTQVGNIERLQLERTLIARQSRSSFVLPDCLGSAPIAALHQTYSPQALKSTPTVAGSMSAGQYNIWSDGRLTRLTMFSPTECAPAVQSCHPQHAVQFVHGSTVHHCNAPQPFLESPPDTAPRQRPIGSFTTTLTLWWSITEPAG